MINVELIYDATCPNVKEARAQLLRAFSQTGLSAHWQEWERSDPESPAYAKGYGSPTILVNGQDIAEAVAFSEVNACRIYQDKDGTFKGIPSVETITSALHKIEPEAISTTGATGKKSSYWSNIVAAIPAVGAALLPKMTCPACWPAYAGLLSTLGLGFVDYTPYLFPLTGVFLIIAVGTIWWQARKSGRYIPLWLGLLATVVVLVGKFRFEPDPVMYSGIGLLVIASLLSSWPRRVAASASCSACAPAGDRVYIRAR